MNLFSRENKKLYGYILGIISAACYGLNPLFALPMYKENISVDSVIFYRYLFSAVILAFLMLTKGEKFRIRKNEILPFCIMGALFLLSSLFLFYSYNYIDVGIASTILFLYPIFVAIINLVLFKERLALTTIISLIVCLFGVYLLCGDGTGKTVSLVGIGLVTLSSLSYAVYIIGINRSKIKAFSALKLTFYAILIGTIFMVFKLELLTNLDMLTTTTSVSYALGLALFPTIISLMLLSMAVKFIGSTPTAILGSLEPVTGIFVGVWVFGEILTGRIITGVLLILMAVTIIITEKKINSSIKQIFKAK